MKSASACFTGHRNIAQNDAIFMPPVIKKVTENLYLKGVTHFRAGGAVGFDTVAALCVLEAKEKHPDIFLDLILPCRDQSRAWDELNRRTYDYILSTADSIEYISEKYTPGCMYERNRRLVYGCSFCIAYCTHSSGGTAYTLSYAQKQNLEIINIYDILKQSSANADIN